MAEFVARSASYSEKELLRDLKSWWEQEVNDPFSSPKSKMTVFDLGPPMDSLRVVNALLIVEKHIGQEFPVKNIKKGGYQTFQEFVGDIMKKVGQCIAENEPASAKSLVRKG